MIPENIMKKVLPQLLRPNIPSMQGVSPPPNTTKPIVSPKGQGKKN